MVKRYGADKHPVTWTCFFIAYVVVPVGVCLGRMVLQRIFSAAMGSELIWAEQLGLEEGDQIWGHLDRMAVRVERWDCFGVQPVVRFQERKLSPLFSDDRCVHVEHKFSQGPTTANLGRTTLFGKGPT